MLSGFTKVIGGLLLLGGTWAGCAPEFPRDPGVLVWHMTAEPDTLNPLTSTDAYASRIQGFVYDTLLERNNQTLDWEPKMAERWEISPDHKRFTFTLRDGIRWHDGMPVTTDDIVYSFERIMDPEVDAPHLRVYYRDIEKIERLDARRVRFTYNRPYFMALDFCGGIPIVPKHLFTDGHDFNSHPQNRNPTGMGPFRFVSWETGKQITLVRNDDYWGSAIGRIPALKAIRFKIVSDDTVALQILKKGGLDLAALRPIQWIRQTQSERFAGRYNRYQFYTPNYRYIAWNLRSRIFRDRRVRQALTMLVNRRAILEKLHLGLGREVTGPFYIDAPEYEASLPPLPYDPLAALRLLREAGWGDGDGDGILDKGGETFRFEFLIPAGRRSSELLATLLKEDLAQVGIAMEIRKVEWALFQKHLSERRFDAVSLGWVFGFEQDPYQLWHSSQVEKGSNFVGFVDPEADQIIERARQEFDRGERVKLYRRLHRILYREQPYTFLFIDPNLLALHRRFENVKVYPGGIDPLEWRLASRVE